jgi:hypothetical protein
MKNLKLFEDFAEEINEGITPLLSILSTPQAIGFSSDPKDSESILLAQRRSDGSVIPGTTHRYSIKGEYGYMGFDVALRNVRRDRKTGDLLAQAKPTGFLAGKLMKLLPSKNKTADGWLYVQVPVAKLNSSISNLLKNKGQKAEIDAGQGVSVTLKYKGPVS